MVIFPLDANSSHISQLLLPHTTRGGQMNAYAVIIMYRADEQIFHLL